MNRESTLQLLTILKLLKEKSWGELTLIEQKVFWMLNSFGMAYLQNYEDGTSEIKCYSDSA